MRLITDVYVDGRCWPSGCRPHPDVAARIGEHAWEDGEPTVAPPPGDFDEQDTGGPGHEPAPPVNPATLDGTLMGEVEDEPEQDEPDGPGVDVPSTAPAPGPPLPEPPRVGPGASRVRWVAYADAHGVTVTETMTRDDIVAAVTAAR